MGNESIEASFLSVFALITFFIFLLVNKYSHKIKSGSLLDSNFEKPQAFHETPVTRSGGLACVLSMFIFYGIYFLLYSKILYGHLLLGISMFFIGFIDDLRINIKPSERLLLMIMFLFIFIYFLPIQILNLDIQFLSFLVSNKLLSTIFVLLCFLFIINGANLIDGFNGLLSINLIIINLILTYINMTNNIFDLAIISISQIIILLSFTLFNFPNAKIFLGDGGAYLMGSIIALNVILTNNFNPQISSFFFCTLVFYLFFEVFFSFLRKLYQKKSPIHPDGKHLHMLIFYKISNKHGIPKANYLTSILINFCYFILILPGLYFINNPILSRYWFFALLLIYTVIYLRLYRLTKN